MVVSSSSTDVSTTPSRVLVSSSKDEVSTVVGSIDVASTDVTEMLSDGVGVMMSDVTNVGPGEEAALLSGVSAKLVNSSVDVMLSSMSGLRSVIRSTGIVLSSLLTPTSRLGDGKTVIPSVASNVVVTTARVVGGMMIIVGVLTGVDRMNGSRLRGATTMSSLFWRRCTSCHEATGMPIAVDSDPSSADRSTLDTLLAAGDVDSYFPQPIFHQSCAFVDSSADVDNALPAPAAITSVAPRHTPGETSVIC